MREPSMGPWDGFVDQSTEIQSVAPTKAMSVKWEATAEGCELPSCWPKDSWQAEHRPVPY